MLHIKQAKNGQYYGSWQGGNGRFTLHTLPDFHKNKADVISAFKSFLHAFGVDVQQVKIPIKDHTLKISKWEGDTLYPNWQAADNSYGKKARGAQAGH